MTETGNGFGPKRVLDLYGKPGFETWELIGKTLRVPRGTAWNLAHGNCCPTPRALHYLELAEWRLNCLCAAVANLAELIGVDAPVPVVFARAGRKA